MKINDVLVFLVGRMTDEISSILLFSVIFVQKYDVLISMKRLILIFAILSGLRVSAQNYFQEWKDAIQYDMQSINNDELGNLFDRLKKCYKPLNIAKNEIRSEYVDSLENARRRINLNKIKQIQKEAKKSKTALQYLKIGTDIFLLHNNTGDTRARIARYNEDSILNVLALNYYKQAYNYSKDADTAVGVLFRIGELYHLEGEDITALNIFNHSLLIEANDDKLRCQLLWGVIRTLYPGEYMIDKELAIKVLPYYKEFIVLYSKYFPNNIPGCISVFSEFGYISKVAGAEDYLDYCRYAIKLANDNNEAVSIFLQNIFSQIGYVSSPNIILGDYYASVGKYEEALRQYETAHIVRENDFIDIEPDNIYDYFAGNIISPIYTQSLSYPLHISKLAVAKYLIGDEQYIKYLNESYLTAIRHLLRDFKTDVKNVRDYQFRMYQHILSLQYHNPDAKWAYNAALFIKGITNNVDMDIKALFRNPDGSLQPEYNKYLELAAKLQKNPSKYALIELQRQELDLIHRYPMLSNHLRSLLYTYQDIQNVIIDNHICAVEFVSAPSFACDEETYYALIISNNLHNPIKVELCNSKELEHIYEKLYLAYSEYLTELYNLIWSKLEPYINEGDEVYFSPSGLLHQINIEVLQDENGRLANEKYNLHRVSSTRELCIERPKTEYTSAVLYGGLKYDMNSTELLAQSRAYSRKDGYTATRGFITDSTSRGINWGYLKGTKSEVLQIENYLHQNNISTTSYIAQAGTEESFKALSGKKTPIIHLATHGFFYTNEEAQKKSYFEMLTTNPTSVRPDNSLKRSGLILAGAQLAWEGKEIPDSVEDGILLAEEIATMDLSGTDLVVLSACETGLGEITSEGVFGLQRAFKKAGVQTLIMSLWKVDDEATQLMMTTFYKEWLSGKSKHEAFAIAQQTVRSNKDYQNPFYWASFIMLD